MSVAAIYDIHGNLPALEAVCAEIRRSRVERVDVQLRHTAYDLPDAADRMRRSGYPMAEDFAANNILRPPTEEAMLAAFERS